MATAGAPTERVAPGPVRGSRARALLPVGLPLLVGLVHVALVAPHYFVGSFDDDASYILTAKGLLAGAGLTGRLPSGQVVVGLYPPGYSALLAPLVWLWPHNFLPLRLLSVASYAAVFPLTGLLLARRGWSPRRRGAALLLLAVGPPFATFGSMVMAEAPFVVVLLLLLLAVDRWRDDKAVLTPAGLTVAVTAAATVWLKQAAIGLVAGMLLWLVLGGARRGRAKAGFLALTTGVMLAPVVVARLAAGVPLAGARYSQELGGYYQGGLLRRLVDVLPGSAWHMVSTVLPETVVPYLEPLPIDGHWPDLWQAVSLPLFALIATGAVVWFARHRDAAVPMVAVYLLESALWPFVNERRTVLVVPLVAAWMAGGAAWWWDWMRAHVRDAGRRRLAATTAAVAAIALILVPDAVQMPRDYLYGWGQSGSHFGGSRYARLLAALGRPADVVETDYQSSTALFTGHATNWNAFVFSQPGGLCYPPEVFALLAADRATYLLLGDVNKPGVLDNPCLLELALGGGWAVPLLHTARDQASVWELYGPTVGRRQVADLLEGIVPAYGTSGDTTSITWTFPSPRSVGQVSVGQATLSAGRVRTVRLQLERPDGKWVTVASGAAGAGDGAGDLPFLMATPAAREAAAVRVQLVGAARDAAASGNALVSDVAALGPPPAS